MNKKKNIQKQQYAAPSNGFAIRNLNPTSNHFAAKNTANNSRNMQMDTLNTEEKQEVANMMRYLDEKIQNSSQEPDQPAQNYIEPLEMKHEESLYKDASPPPQRKNAGTANLPQSESPGNISVEYYKPKQYYRNQNHTQTSDERENGGPNLPIPATAAAFMNEDFSHLKRHQQRDHTNSKITLSSSIASSTKELL